MITPPTIEWGLRSSGRRGSATWSVGDRALIAWIEIRDEGSRHTLEVWWPERQGLPPGDHTVGIVMGGARYVTVSSTHREQHLAVARADEVVRGIHQRAIEARRAELQAELAALDGQSSSASQPRTDDGTRSDASLGGATSGGTSATGASG